MGIEDHLGFLGDAYEQYVLSFDAKEMLYVAQQYGTALLNNQDFLILLTLFIASYVAFSVLQLLARTVFRMLKFAIYVGLAIALYWVAVSIDVEKGNQELRSTTKHVVNKVRGVVREAVNSAVPED